MLVQLADVDFAYPGTDILRNVSWQVNPGDRIGLVGPNGAGKSTLLRLLAGQLQPDRGQVARAKGVTLAYLQQSQEFHGHGTLRDTLLEPFAALLAMRQELATLEHSLSNPTDLDRYGHLQEVYTRRGGYTLESRLGELAAELGFGPADLERPVGSLSGGERGRVELGKVLLAEPDLLLLDEPTNHLDVETVEHLEERLQAWAGAFVVVSHDRYLLRAVCREIVDVEGTSLVRYAGGYEKYVAERQARLERLGAAYRRQQEAIEKTEDFIRKNIAGQNTKQAQSRRKMLAKLERLERPRDHWAEAGAIKLRFSTGGRMGGKVAIAAKGLELGFGDAPPLLAAAEVTIYRGERVGIVGPNGAGKTTLLKTLLGLAPPRRGTVEQGVDLAIGYFDQKLSGLGDERSLIEEIRTIRGDWNEDVVRNYLGLFRFSGDEVFRKVKGLSGGELNRMALAKMMLLPRNLLALDEPTNHLDIPAREVLEEALEGYDGTIVVVSHDRYFLDRICRRILHLNEGRLDPHVGNYTDWRRRLKAAQRPAPAAEPARVTERAARAADHEAERRAQRERQRKERRLAELEKEIAATEAKLAAAREALGSNHGGEWQKLHALVEEESALDDRVKRLLGEWERLGDELSRSETRKTT